jgi:hypothetical protein
MQDGSQFQPFSDAVTQARQWHGRPATPQSAQATYVGEPGAHITPGDLDQAIVRTAFDQQRKQFESELSTAKQSFAAAIEDMRQSMRALEIDNTRLRQQVRALEAERAERGGNHRPLSGDERASFLRQVADLESISSRDSRIRLAIANIRDAIGKQRSRLVSAHVVLAEPGLSDGRRRDIRNSIEAATCTLSDVIRATIGLISEIDVAVRLDRPDSKPSQNAAPNEGNAGRLYPPEMASGYRPVVNSPNIQRQRVGPIDSPWPQGRQ